MSIATEIARLQQAKADIAEAIAKKGGEVSGTIDTYAQAIADLPSGGGISEEYYNKLITGHLDEPIIFPEGITKIERTKFYYLNDGNEEVCPLAEIPKSVTSIGSAAFRYARIKKIIVRSTSSSNSTYIFGNNIDLEEIIFNGLMSSGNMCQGCSNLKRVIYNNPKTSRIEGNSFNNCTSLELIDLSKATQVNSLSSTNAFSGVPLTCEIRVPSALYDTWIKATNWSTLYAQGYNFVAV